MFAQIERRGACKPSVRSTRLRCGRRSRGGSRAARRAPQMLGGTAHTFTFVQTSTCCQYKLTDKRMRDNRNQPHNHLTTQPTSCPCRRIACAHRQAAHIFNTTPRERARTRPIALSRRRAVHVAGLRRRGQCQQLVCLKRGCLAMAREALGQPRRLARSKIDAWYSQWLGI